MRLSTLLLPLLPAFAFAINTEDGSAAFLSSTRGKLRVRDHPNFILRRQAADSLLPSPQSEPRGGGGNGGNGQGTSDLPHADPTTVPQPPSKVPNDPPGPTPTPEPQPQPKPQPQPQPEPQPQPGPTPADPGPNADPGKPQAPNQPQVPAPAPTPDVIQVTRGSDGHIVTVIRSRTSTVLASTPSQNATASRGTTDSNLSQSGSSSSSGLGPGKIVGIAIGGAVAIILAAIGIFLFRKWGLRPSNKFRDRLMRANGGSQTSDSMHESIGVSPSPSPSPHPFDHAGYAVNGLRSPPSTWRMSHQYTSSMSGSMGGPPSMGRSMAGGSMVGSPSMVGPAGPPSMVGGYDSYHPVDPYHPAYHRG
ncbi:uncharacterized protein EV422DRAFT_518839 [Fimicolochytrium jonesii]|uniref:uncharacterized protein n=1 Tax=Fimicolochytrium jonesii TaxID=1396493 RepID=UPI0022FDF177|nr:uncharacterized protein EV422DRAFT_518839 [Fimicolochytrium jonesii]KAI8824091.1 hypothetical protein EV422DRAFT_518839 [Fimicolochytrium jonesii]